MNEKRWAWKAGLKEKEEMMDYSVNVLSERATDKKKKNFLRGADGE